MAKEYITLHEFQSLSLISSEELLCMLSQGQLKFLTGSGGELLIEISELDQKTLANRASISQLGFTLEEERLFQEVVASEIVKEIDLIIEEGLVLALKWMEEQEALPLDEKQSPPALD